MGKSVRELQDTLNILNAYCGNGTYLRVGLLMLLAIAPEPSSRYGLNATKQQQQQKQNKNKAQASCIIPGLYSKALCNYKGYHMSTHVIRAPFHK